VLDEAKELPASLGADCFQHLAHGLQLVYDFLAFGGVMAHLVTPFPVGIRNGREEVSSRPMAMVFHFLYLLD